MTVSSATSKSGPYAGNGATVTFAYGFKVFSASDLQVILRSSTGVETVLTLTTHYSVNGVGLDAGGTITMVTAPASGQTLTIVRSLALTQEVDLRNQGGFYPEVHERVFDRLTMQVQQVAEELNRSITFPVSDAAIGTTVPSAAVRANKVLVFDAAGAPGVTDVAGLASVTAAAYVGVQELISTGAETYTLLVAPGTSAMIEVSVGGLVQSPSVDYSVSGNTLTFAGIFPPAGERIIVRWIIATTASQVTLQNQVYTGTDSSNLDYPIGTTLVVNTDVRVYTRNQSNAIRRAAANTSEFCDSGLSGTALTGTWRCRGMIGAYGYAFFQRVA
jgi:hypothetical protein